MPKVEWSYHRAGCNTCAKTEEFLAAHDVTVTEKVNAKKTILQVQQALELLHAADELYVTRGKTVIHHDFRKGRPSDEELLKLVIGPSGKLRAPTLRRGKTLIVGFDEATYAKLFT